MANIVTNKKDAAERLNISVDQLNAWLESGCPGKPGEYDIDAMIDWSKNSKPANDTPDPQQSGAEARGRQSNAPNCPIHGVACVSNHSSPYFTYYYCPDPGCSYSQKIPRPNLQQHLRRQRAREADHPAR